jgi:CRP-like cAMP-binding protein
MPPAGSMGASRKGLRDRVDGPQKERGASRGSENRLLAAILRERPALQVHCEPVDLPAGAELYVEGHAPEHVYFPTRGIVSIVLQLAEGETSEVLTVGREGMIGVPVWLGLKKSLETVLQLRPGELVRVPAGEFCQTVEGSRRVRELLHHYVAYNLRSTAQLIACSKYHTVEQRICRWLLSAMDHAGGREISLSQVALGAMLGVRRQTIGDVALRLQREQLIAYRRGQIRVPNRSGLEARACECYRTLRQLYREILATRLVQP